MARKIHYHRACTVAIEAYAQSPCIVTCRRCLKNMIQVGQVWKHTSTGRECVIIDVPGLKVKKPAILSMREFCVRFRVKPHLSKVASGISQHEFKKDFVQKWRPV